MSAAGGCRPNHGHHGHRDHQGHHGHSDHQGHHGHPDHQGHQAPVLGGQEIPSDVYPQHGSIQLEKLPLGSDSLVWARGGGSARPSGDAAGTKVRVVGNNPQVVSVRRGSGRPGRSGLNEPASPPRQVAPSSVFHNGTDLVFTVSPRRRRTSRTRRFRFTESDVSSPPVSRHHADAGGR